MEKRKNRHSRVVKARASAKLQTPKILDRLTYDPNKHKQKVTRELRHKLQKKALPSPPRSHTTTSLKFGSINLNGLDLETSWAVEQLVLKHEFDVRLLLL